MFEVISRIYQNLHSIQFLMKSKSSSIQSSHAPFESLPETRCSVNAILRQKCMYGSSHPPMENEMQRKREWRAGRQNRGYSHGLRARMLQCKHVSCGEYASNKCEQARKSFEVISRIYQNLHSIQFLMKSKSSSIQSSHAPFESLPETRCSVNAILRQKCMYGSSHPPNGKLAVTKRKNPPRKKCKELQSSA